LNLWNDILTTIGETKDRTTISLLKEIKKVELKDNTLYISTPDNVFKEWILSNFIEDIEKHASQLVGQKLNINVISEEEIRKNLNVEDNPTKIKQEEKPYRFYRLNPKFVFSNFIVGSCNKIAYSACKAVAENLGEIYNPLFIYGEVGLGKTHLLHATAHEVLSKNSNANVIYTTADTFMSELISCMRQGSILQFRQRYRDVDLLLIDDVQFLEGKERTQVEFYHIFNALHLIGKQIILSSDTSPSKLTGIQERLKTRFVCGLVTEVKPPDLETKLSIIRKKSKEIKLELPQDVMLFISKTVNTNVRELEGSLQKLKAYNQIMERPITLEVAREILKDILKIQNVEELSIQKIQKEVANYFAVNLNEMLGNSRRKKVSLARQIAMYLSRYLTDKSLAEISKAFKKKDHTTIINAIQKIEKTMERDRKLKLTVEFLRDKILTL